MKVVFCCLLLATSWPVIGQDSTKAEKKRSAPVAATNAPADNSIDHLRMVNGMSNPNASSIIWTSDTRYEGLVGTPYFLPNWSKGTIERIDGTRLTDVPLKFDAAKQSLVVLRPSRGDSIEVLPQQVRRFTMSNAAGQEVQFKRYAINKANDPDVANGYFMVLHEGKTTLLKRIKKNLQKANYQGGYSPNIRQDSYTNEFAYYLLRPDQTLTKVKMSKKSLLEGLSDKEATLKPFVEEQKLTFKSEEDMVRLVQQYNTL